MGPFGPENLPWPVGPTLRSKARAGSEAAHPEDCDSRLRAGSEAAHPGAKRRAGPA